MENPHRSVEGTQWPLPAPFRTRTALSPPLPIPRSLSRSTLPPAHRAPGDATSEGAPGEASGRAEHGVVTEAVGLREERAACARGGGVWHRASGARSELASGGARDTRPQGRDRLRARQGSPVAKRRAPPHRRAPRTGHLHRQHRHPRLHERSRHHRERHRHATPIAAEQSARVSTGAGTTPHGERAHAPARLIRTLRERERRKGGGAAAERGAEGAGRREGERRRWRAMRWCPAKERGPRRRTDAALGCGLRLRPRSAGPGCRAPRPCRRGCR